MANSYTRVIRDGLWDNNIIFTQMLALCPLMALTSTATNGLGMGLATMLVLILTNAIISMVRNMISPEVRIPVFVLLIAAVVTVVDMVINAWMHELHKVLGLFLPLIVTNCAILGRAESFASRNSVLHSVTDGFSMGLGFTFALTLLGIVREISASGTVFSHASALLGDHFAFLETTLIPHYRGFLLMMLPPGGFLALGFVLAAKRLLSKRRQAVVALQEESIGCH
ncbi:MAG: RnfABCDGE type electron transport complex subunit E [Gammaproteobacteria bacterium]|nr:RnfABCDGE type electron transport complex subunit E [Gammaproteobacteria bacterium]